MLSPEEHDAFFEPEVSEESGTLYEHCVRGLNYSLTKGPHGLPLFGTGDWNDAMNRVGYLGRVKACGWAGSYMQRLRLFCRMWEARGKKTLAEKWRKYLNGLKAALENNAWDGAWYRRGYFDDGTPLGTASAEECRIDSLVQSWRSFRKLPTACGRERHWGRQIGS